MESPLEEIEFLALSPNRVDVLELLSDGRYTRRELAEATGASQATLGRILGDFDERSWIRREDSRYVATATGRLVSGGVSDLREIVETERKLRDVVEYMPTESLSFDLRRLSEARITAPSQTRPNAPVQRLLELLEDASEVRTASHAFNEQTLSIVRERVTAGELTFDGVFSESAIDALAEDAGLRARLESLLEADGARIWIVDEDVPLAVVGADEAVALLLRDADGVLRAAVDVDDDAVRSWAEETVREYRTRATPLESEALRTD
ncbi:helix-turn-helix transcriptional regulator [Natrarchaeobius oligotrophus]|uniref:ArsR family transcriptional regulator n=1 Tax=Natrarchaeobius chitinivorans TaxID=1679083 RepID=A0A3N6MUF4_NATCH|nr:ArsR family transcriptional regulator [Natrarchaeobius chitinivorans]RQG99931.1 ArsR family transcriptional regulator [Natrarchaeobius chitinivorans]